MKEKEVLIQSHENFITETKIYHDNLTKDLEQKIQDIKQENLRELENAYQQRVRMIDEEKKSKEHYKSKVEDLKQKLQSITSNHQDICRFIRLRRSNGRRLVVQKRRWLRCLRGVN